jgi:2,4-diketo-3-deoxy-L-fuconate hydrolase
VCDLSGVISDVASAALLPVRSERIRALDLKSLPLVDGTPKPALRLDA